MVLGKGSSWILKYTVAFDLSTDPAGKTVATCHCLPAVPSQATHSSWAGDSGFSQAFPPVCSYELNVFKDTWRQTAEQQNRLHGPDTEGRDKQAQVSPLAVESRSPVTPAPHFTEGSMCTVHSVTSPNTKGTAEHSQQMMDICYHYWNITQP